MTFWDLLGNIGFLQFTKLEFIAFLLMLIIIYYIAPLKRRWIVLLIASVMFYISAGLSKIPYILITSLSTWMTGRSIGKEYLIADEFMLSNGLTGKERMLYFHGIKKKCRNRYLIPAIVLNVTLLSWFKLGNQIVDAINSVTVGGKIGLAVIMPLGISYYTFMTLGYMLDVYWRKEKFIHNYFHYALCVFFFPQIVEGPIGKYSRLEPQLFAEHKFDYQNFCFGLQLMCYGYAKKMIIADRLAAYTSAVFSSVGSYEGLVIVLAVFASAFQIYMDFSGCMDIVRGTAQLFGIELDQNFNHPFFSKNVAEFWRRWHMTLGLWFKDYVYMPIVTSGWLIKITSYVKRNRDMKAAKAYGVAIPLFIVWFLTGLWHGTGLNYIVWGFYYGILIICRTVYADSYKELGNDLHLNMESAGYKRFQMIRTFIAFSFGRLITAPGTLAATALAIHQIFSCFNPWVIWDGTLYQMGLDYKDWCVV